VATTDNELDRGGKKGVNVFDFVSVWATATLCHFGLMVGGSCVLGILPPWLQATVEWGLGAFAMAAEELLRRLIDYRGADRYQWTIIYFNSVLYGLLFALVWRHFALHGRRRGFPVDNRDVWK